MLKIVEWFDADGFDFVLDEGVPDGQTMGIENPAVVSLAEKANASLIYLHGRGRSFFDTARHTSVANGQFIYKLRG